MTIKITGRGTYEHRHTIKATGAKWDGISRCWTLPDNAPATTLDALRALPGVTVETPAPIPNPHAPREREPAPEPVTPVPVERIGRTTIFGNDQTYLGTMDEKHPTMFAGFANLSDMIDFIECIPASIKNDKINSRNIAWNGSADWAGTADMQGAIRLARNGWTDGVNLAAEASEILQADHATQRQRTLGVAGGRVNVGRMLTGNPLHMQSRQRQPAKKVITLYVDIWMAALIKAEHAIIRAACVAAMVDLLEHNGYSCEIVAVGIGKVHGLTAQIAVPLKRAGETLNLNDVVFALGHPSMLRRLCLALPACDPNLYRFWPNMGYQAFAFKETEPGSFYIPKLVANIEGDTFEERVRSAFEAIIPDGFPVRLNDPN